jgi:hypothetical protein
MKMNVVLLEKGVQAARMADWLYDNEQYQSRAESRKKLALPRGVD